MKFIKQKIKGVILIKPKIFKDDRGRFNRSYCLEEYRKNGIIDNFKQTNLSFNIKKNTIRGFHYQLPPNEENKTISCLSGSIYDIVVDLRFNSSTFLKWQHFLLNEENAQTLYIPAGCANAFQTQKNNTLISYYHSGLYKPQSEARLGYDDPYFNFIWPSKPSVISKKDLIVDNFRLINIKK